MIDARTDIVDSEDLAILLQNFGEDTHPESGAPGGIDYIIESLYRHPDDYITVEAGTDVAAHFLNIGFADTNDPNFWPRIQHRTPWHEEGIADWSAWTTEFLARWDVHNVGINVPAPSRFHFESEPPFTGAPGLNLLGFHAARKDPRWDTLELEAFPRPAPATGHYTLKELWQQFRATLPIDQSASNYQPGLPTQVTPYMWNTSDDFQGSEPSRHTNWNTEINRPFHNWYTTVLRQSYSHAMNEAAYTHIRAKWSSISDVQTSDYDYRHLGGVDDVAWDAHTDNVFPNRNNPWYNYAEINYADISTAELYYFNESATYPELDAYLIAERTIESIKCNDELREFVPWLRLPGSWGTGGTLPPPHTEPVLRAYIERLWTAGVDEFIVFQSDSATVSDWESLDRVVDDLALGLLDGTTGLGLSAAAIADYDRDGTVECEDWNDFYCDWTNLTGCGSQPGSFCDQDIWVYHCDDDLWDFNGQGIGVTSPVGLGQCPADIDGNGFLDVEDLLAMLLAHQQLGVLDFDSCAQPNCN